MKLLITFLTFFIFSFVVNALPSPAARQTSLDLSTDYTYTTAHVVEPRQAVEISAISAAADLGYKIGGYIGDIIVGLKHKIGNDKKVCITIQQPYDVVVSFQHIDPLNQFVRCGLDEQRTWSTNSKANIPDSTLLSATQSTERASEDNVMLIGSTRTRKSRCLFIKRLG